MIMSTCGVSSSGTSSTSGSPAGALLLDAVRLVRRDQVDPPLRAPVQVQAHHQPRRALAGDQRRDGVEEAAQRVDGSAVGRGDRRRHPEERAEPHAGAVEQQDGRGHRLTCRSVPVAHGVMAFAVDRIDHVVVNCRDVEATVDWYVRVLGMTRRKFGDGRIALTFGDQKINVRPTGAPNWVTGGRRRAGHRWTCASSPTPRPDDVGAHLRACGVEITEGPVAKTGALGPDDVALLPRSRRQPGRGRQLPARRLASTPWTPADTGRFGTDVYARTAAGGDGRGGRRRAGRVWSSRPATTCATSSGRGRRPSSG